MVSAVQALGKLMRGKAIVKYTRARGGKTKRVRKMTELNSIGMRSGGHLKNIWVNEVLSDLKKLKMKNWKYLVRDRKAWCGQLQKANTHKGLSCQQK
jgi:hypothetical protein